MATDKKFKLEMLPKRTVNGVRYVDGTRSEAVNAAWLYLESISGKIVWIVADAHDNGESYGSLVSLVHEKVKAIICIGNRPVSIDKYFASEVRILATVTDLPQAVKLASVFAKKDNTVLFAPTSPNPFSTKGEEFRNLVNAL